jgi:hypothetical protein
VYATVMQEFEDCTMAYDFDWREATVPTDIEIRSDVLECYLDLPVRCERDKKEEGMDKAKRLALETRKILPKIKHLLYDHCSWLASELIYKSEMLIENEKH